MQRRHPCPPAVNASRRRALLRALVLAVPGVLLLGSGAAAAAAKLEASVKAAYLYKFTGFVEWPPRAFAGAATPIVIGVVDAPEVLDELAPVLVGRSIQGRPLKVRQVSPGDALDGLHVLYVPSTGALPPAWLEAARSRPLLLVTDEPGGLEAGGMLNFLLQDGRVRFEASVPAAERAGIKLSARLLAVAERVIPLP